MADWRRIRHAAQAEAHRFSAALENPRAAQLSLLQGILAANAGCEFGVAHGFASMETLEEFRARVPIAGYDSVAPAIARMAQGDAGVLTSAPVIAFEETGGSSAGAKLVPITAPALAGFSAAILPWLSSTIDRLPQIANGPFYATISPATRSSRTTSGGIPIGLGSDAAYLGPDLARDFAALLAVPPQLGDISDVTEWQVATLAALVEASELSFISLWSPTFLSSLLAALPICADQIAARLSPQAYARFAAATRGHAPDAAVLWPCLASISCWNDGPSRHFAGQLAERFPQARIDAKGILATEGAITLGWGPHGRKVPALNSCVIEFVDAKGVPLLCDELTEGETYRVVMTTAGGLYRYDLGDIVECKAMIGNVPDLAFLGRAGIVSDMVGEKLEQAFVAQVLDALGYPAALEARADGPGYILLVDRTAPPGNAAPAVDAALQANPQYAYARRIGQLAPLRTQQVADLPAHLNARGMAAGRRMGDVKPLGLVRADPVPERAA